MIDNSELILGVWRVLATIALSVIVAFDITKQLDFFPIVLPQLGFSAIVTQLCHAHRAVAG